MQTIKFIFSFFSIRSGHLLFFALSALFLMHCAKGSSPAVCGNGVCEKGETHETCPEDCPEAVCGNDKVDPGEQCDGSDLDGKNCAALGFGGGTLLCAANCTFDTGSCQSSCQSNCTLAGVTRCSGNILQTCTQQTAQCLTWVQTTDCTQSGQICDDSSGTATCSDDCTDACEDGDGRCQTNMLQSCQLGENGCTQWKDQQDCSAINWVCTGTGDASACVDPCDHLCNPGDPPQCAGNIVQTCQADGQGCRVWVSGTDCATLGQVCSGGACSCVHECTLGTTRCDGTLRQGCATSAHGCRFWETLQDCASGGQICSTGSGAAQCVNACSDACTSGTFRCLGDTLQYCQTVSSGCLDWVDHTNCSASGRSCSSNQCVCNHACSSGQTRCVGDMAQSCTQDTYGCFQWTDSTNCAALGQTCLNGACQSASGNYLCSNLSTSYTTIRYTGTSLTTDTYMDDGRYAFTIPFTFRYYGTNFTGGWFCTNGWVSFGADPGTNDYFNGTLPNTAMPNAALYPFWDDLVYDQSTFSDARILYQTTGSSPNRVFILEFHQFRYVGTGSSGDHRGSYQVRLYEGSNAFEFIYDRSTWMGGNWSGTIGYENIAGTVGHHWGTNFTAPPSSDLRCVPQ